MKLYAIIGGFLYNDIQGVCSEDFIDQVMSELDENEKAVKFAEITEQEWESYEEWIGDKTMPAHREILGRRKLQPHRILGWRLE